MEVSAARRFASYAMYLDYFSLKRHPFRITPDPSLFFAGGSHGRGVVLDALVYGITSGEGILKVVGEVGSGKTMLCRMLEERLPDSIKIVYLANPSLSARDIVYAIAIELALDVDAATDRLMVMHKLQEYLLKRHAAGGSVVVFVEEAQSMPLETLEEVRLLSNLETHEHKLMQIVLFGQPELDRKLEQKSIRQLRERITHSFNLAPLTEDDTREYLHFRLRAAGCPWPQLFHPKAERILARASAGLTRRINILADKALLASYADPATRPQARSTSGEILPMVLPSHVKTAIADSAYKRGGPGGRYRHWPGYAAAALGGAAVVAVALWFMLPRMEETIVPEPAASSATAVAVTTPVARTEEEQPPQPRSNPVEAAPAAKQEPVAAERAGEAPPSSVTGTNAVMALTPAERSTAVSEAAIAATEAAATEAAARETVTAATDEAAAQEDEQEQEQASGAADQPPLPGLAGIRLQASAAWLEQAPARQGYSVQLFSAAVANTYELEEFLEFLQLTDLLDESYLCLISGNNRREEQWLVLQGEFAGLSDARRFVNDLPPYIKQYGPYVRNIDGIACSNDRL